MPRRAILLTLLGCAPSAPPVAPEAYRPWTFCDGRPLATCADNECAPRFEDRDGMVSAVCAPRFP